MEATIGDVGLLYKGLGVVGGEVSIGGSKQTVDTPRERGQMNGNAQAFALLV
jgi:hypothetical protein